MSRICPHEWSFELLAFNREQLEIAATVFATQTSDAAVELFRKITQEVIPQLDREAKLAERRIRRMTRVENEIDWSAFAFNDFGTRTRRARKEVSYKEMDENDIQPVDVAPRRPRATRGARDEEDYVEEEHSEEDEEDIPLHFRQAAAPPRQTRYETRGVQQSYSEKDAEEEDVEEEQDTNEHQDAEVHEDEVHEDDDEDSVMNDDETSHQNAAHSDSDYADQSTSAMQTEVSV